MDEAALRSQIQRVMEALIRASDEDHPTARFENAGQAWSGVERICNLLGRDAISLRRIMERAPEQGGEHWETTEYFTRRAAGACRELLGALSNGLLTTLRLKIAKEMLGNLIDQADDLLPMKHPHAAVIGRAAAEENLRALAEHLGCLPKKERPGLNDYNEALYAAQALSKPTMMMVKSIAALGNAAAHADSEFDATQVPAMLTQVRTLIATP